MDKTVSHRSVHGLNRLKWCRFLVHYAGVVTGLVGIGSCSAVGSDSVGGGNHQVDSSGPDQWIAPAAEDASADLSRDAACAYAVQQAKRIPLDIFFSLDTSGSMKGEKLALLKAGLTGFMKLPSSEGIGVSGQRFPLGGELESCEPNDYAVCAAPWEILPNNSLASWISALDANGFTPSVAALRGAVNACMKRKAESAGRKCAVVFVSDGEPEGNCLPIADQAKIPLRAIAQEAFEQGIPVFAVAFYGISSLGQQILINIAQKGGTKNPFAIHENNVSQDFIDALMTASGRALGCDYQMPESSEGHVNPNLVRVIYTPGKQSESRVLGRKRTLNECGSEQGWAYDDNDHPTKLVMCPASCDLMQHDADGNVEVLLGCTGFIK